MKEIKAYIKVHKLNELMRVLKDDYNVHGVTVCQNHLSGIQDIYLDELLDYVRVDFVCKREYVEEIIDDIKTFSRTGLRNDGKIFILPVEQVIEISDEP